MSNPLSTKTSFSSSNYYDFGNEINKSNFESLNTFNLSLQSGNFTATVGIGASTKFNIHSPQKGVTTVPAIEAKLQQNIPFKGKIQPSDTMVNVIVSVPF